MVKRPICEDKLVPLKTDSSDRSMRPTFKDKKIEKEYNQILQKARVVSFLSLIVLVVVLYAVFTDLILLVAFAPPAAATAILQYRYHNRLIELQNSDEARWA